MDSQIKLCLQISKVIWLNSCNEYEEAPVNQLIRMCHGMPPPCFVLGCVIIPTQQTSTAQWYFGKKTHARGTAANPCTRMVVVLESLHFCDCSQLFILFHPVHTNAHRLKTTAHQY